MRRPGQLLIPASECGIRRLGKRRSEMNSIESAQCPALSQFARMMNDFV
jgi:hypothetical protein